MKRIGILVVAYNAASTLHTVLDRIPPEFRSRVDGVLVSDDASSDATYLVGLGYQSIDQTLPLTILRQQQNLGYGGNQKAGYRWAIDNDLDIVVLLHGDGQYAPELLPEMVAPLERDECDAVFGSRMMDHGAARRGGMPLYKYVGNRVLSTVENRLMGASLSEWHSGYRAYSTAALRDIPFERNSDDFDFDTQVIVQLLEAGKRIEEIPIPTFYGDEISHVNGTKYAVQITRYVARYRLQKMGFGRGDLTFATQSYAEQLGASSTHGIAARLLSQRSPRRVLDLSVGDGVLAGRLRDAGHEVVGVGPYERPSVTKLVDRFVTADLDEGLPPEVGTGHDVALAVDLLAHLRRPDLLLRQLRGALVPNGTVLLSVPNVAHWYARSRFALGRFDYDRRGILDEGHLRFFTRRSFTRMATDAGYRVVDARPVGLPLEVIERGGRGGGETRRRRAVRALDRTTLALLPDLFAYQWVFELQPR